MPPFWSIDHLNVADPLNDQIWSDSPAEQLLIQKPESLQAPGAIGAQQCMVDGLATPLPWVPDLAGLNWKHAESIVIIGSAYAPFIQGLSRRSCTLPLADYARARSASDFLSEFLKRVVSPDGSYYQKVAALARDQGTQQLIILFDLCRASYTIRGSRNSDKELDCAAEFTFKDTFRGQRDTARAMYSRRLFTAYLDSEKQHGWTLARLALSRARRIVTLGSVAEYGLLKLFWHSGIKKIHRMKDRSAGWSPEASHGDRWMLRYACKEQSLEKWLIENDWWVINGQLNGEQREWHLLPALHPARNSNDTEYSRTRTVIAAM